MSEEAQKPETIQELGAQYTQLCSQLGEITYHASLLEKRKHELLAQAAELDAKAKAIKESTAAPENKE